MLGSIVDKGTADKVAKAVEMAFSLLMRQAEAQERQAEAMERQAEALEAILSRVPKA